MSRKTKSKKNIKNKKKKIVKHKTKKQSKKLTKKAKVTKPIQKKGNQDQVKALEGSVIRKNISQFELNEIVNQLVDKAKHRKRNRNALLFKEVRSAFDNYN
jgi:signal recognition particle GTPase